MWRILVFLALAVWAFFASGLLKWVLVVAAVAFLLVAVVVRRKRPPSAMTSLFGPVDRDV
jgi:hypothetical protein